VDAFPDLYLGVHSCSRPLAELVKYGTGRTLGHHGNHFWQSVIYCHLMRVCDNLDLIQHSLLVSCWSQYLPRHVDFANTSLCDINVLDAFPDLCLVDCPRAGPGPPGPRADPDRPLEGQGQGQQQVALTSRARARAGQFYEWPSGPARGWPCWPYP
jgi:hypothetical protein